MTLCTFPQRRRQPLRSLPVLERRQVELELQLARQRLKRQQPGGGVRHSLHFSPDLVLGEFCFKSCPFQPPSILPISSILSERAIYLPSFRDLVSHKTNSNTLSVSDFLMANLSHGCFSIGDK